MLLSAAEMEHRGHRVSFWFRDQLAPNLAPSGLRRLFLPWLIVAKVLNAVRRSERFDIVEIHEPLSSAYGLISRLLGSRVPTCVALSHGLEERSWQALIAHLHAYNRKPPLSSRILVPLTLLSQARLGVQTAAAVLVVSSQDRDYLIDSIGVPPQRVSCAFGGVSEQLFHLPRTGAVEPRFLFFGSWIERKGTVELSEAWRRLAESRPGVQITIACGDSADRAREDMPEVPGVEIVSTFTRERLPKLLSTHNVFVLPSWFEGMALSMLEAAAAGLACIVSAVCGSLDLFRPSDPKRDGALLIPPNDARALYAALLTLVDDSQLRATLGARARERAREFTWTDNARRSLDAYLGALERDPKRRAARSR